MVISVFSRAKLIRATAALCLSVCLCVCLCVCVHVYAYGLMVSGFRLQFPSPPNMSEAVNQGDTGIQTHTCRQTDTPSVHRAI